MIIGIAVPANNRLQRTVINGVPRHIRQRAAAVFPLEREAYRQISSAGTHKQVATAIEERQLSAKNDLQKNFLLTQRAEREAR